VTQLTRWRLACALLAGVAGFSFYSHPAGGSDTPARVANVRSASIPVQLRRPIRVSAEAAGISRDDLIERVLRARSLRDVQTLAERLGVVGDDQTVDQLAPLLADHRRGVPEAILACFGVIGSEHAVAQLVEHTSDDRPQIRMAAILALGATQTVEAEKLLIELAEKRADPAQATAITALGALGSDAAVATLMKLANGSDYQIAASAVAAMGSVTSEAAAVALHKLIDSPDSRVAAVALASIDTIDVQMLAWISTDRNSHKIRASLAQ
jgi:HEAT repeat protein